MLCVYDKFTKKDNFNNCGIGILRPSLFKTYEELNGDYSVSIEYPITDQDSTWMYLTPYNIIKNSEGQLFFIHTCGTDMNMGKSVWKAQARHISYYLADKMIFDCKYDNYDCMYALYAMKDHTQISWGDAPGSSYVEYDFYFSSDIRDKLANIDYNAINPINALIGASNSIVNLYGGEIHRDNFRISVDHRKEGSKDNAFSIVHGINMKAVRENISTTDMLTTLRSEDNYGQGKISSFSDVSMAPHQIIKHVKFSYNGESRFDKDHDDYFWAHTEPKLSYEVTFKDLKNIPEYSEWMKFQRYRVGDTGRIFSKLLKIDTKQKVISRTLNDITGETESMTLGNFMPSLFMNSKYNNLLAKNDSAGKRLDVLESKVNMR